MRFSASNASGLMKAEILPCVMQGVILYSVLTHTVCLQPYSICHSKCMLAISPLYKFKRGVLSYVTVKCLVLVFQLFIVTMNGSSVKGTLLSFFVDKQNYVSVQFLAPKQA